MDRTQWRQERRLWNEVQMDTIYARQYDEHWGANINPSHRSMLERLLELCPPRGYLLDAACGTGKYWPLLSERGFSVMGTDQSQQMLQRAHEKFPDVAIQHVGLQELTFHTIPSTAYSVWMRWRWFSLKTGQWFFAILQRHCMRAAISTSQ